MDPFTSFPYRHSWSVARKYYPKNQKHKIDTSPMENEVALITRRMENKFDIKVTHDPYELLFSKVDDISEIMYGEEFIIFVFETTLYAYASKDHQIRLKLQYGTLDFGRLYHIAYFSKF